MADSPPDDPHLTPCTESCSKTRAALRTELRARRQALNSTQQARASAQVLRHLTKIPQFMRARHIALYMANDGELDPQAIAIQLWKMGKQCYLPVLRPDKNPTLWFVEIKPETPLTPNRFGIPEPDYRTERRLSAALLDVALMPLVGFDRQGARLGMGGGFYDRTFAFKQAKPQGTQRQTGRPYLIGLAHACQEVDALTTANWDIPLFAVVTDKEVIYPNA